MLPRSVRGELTLDNARISRFPLKPGDDTLREMVPVTLLRSFEGHCAKRAVRGMREVRTVQQAHSDATPNFVRPSPEASRGEARQGFNGLFRRRRSLNKSVWPVFALLQAGRQFGSGHINFSDGAWRLNCSSPSD
jgi:hypothetical protein